LSLTLHSSIADVKGVGPKYSQVFEKYRIFTVFDYLLHFPLYYIDFSDVSEEVELGVKKLYRFETINWGVSRNFYRRRRFSVLRAKVRIGNDTFSIVFFNKPYLADFFTAHKTAYIYGQFEIVKNICQANTPLIFSEEEKNKLSVDPVYPNIGAIKSGKLKQMVRNIFTLLEDRFESLPTYSLSRHGFPGIVDALRHIHFPERLDPEFIETLKQRFIYGEFFFFQLELQYIRTVFTQVPRTHQYSFTPELQATIQSRLPFQLTPDQQTAVKTITEDLQSGCAMQRLLQGDVGSGKTIVAFIALSTAIASGFQGAFLAPTEILAGQHFSNANRFFNDCRIELLTGSTTAKKRKEILKKLKAGEIDILFGTHALFTETVEFQNLSMVVIDEQHRFGVSQRAALYYKGNAADLLVTTATPIPRTMLLSLYNDLTVSTIKTKPSGRLPIITKIVPAKHRQDFYRLLRKKIEEGEKAYIILPLIEKSDYFAELKDIETESEYFKKVFKGIPFGIVTGRTSAKEKDNMLENFAQDKLHVLVATTVIEVGIDVKDASMIIIEDADRYGLSQLHQLRGRVGRGPKQSYCYLFPSPNITENGKKRLRTIEGTTDGFKIAETDLKMRGGGIIAGLQQSGYLDFKVANMQDHLDLFKEAQKDTSTILKDPSLHNRHIKDFLKTIDTKLKNLHFS
jgi:ATP-dependent DNA helicase RecG